MRVEEKNKRKKKLKKKGDKEGQDEEWRGQVLIFK